MKPGVSQFHIFGPVNSLAVDHATGTILRETKSIVHKLSHLLSTSCDLRLKYLRNARSSISKFLQRNCYQDFGMKELV
jgi:hypothetical protein